MMMAESHRVSGRMRSVRTRVLRTCSTLLMPSMVTPAFVIMLVLCTKLPLTCSSCTFISFLSIKETKSRGKASLVDTLIVTGMGLQSNEVNTEILNYDCFAHCTLTK